MSIYSTSVTTAIIDPAFNSSRRCEFRLPDRDGAYMSNLRLGNVGVTTTAIAPYALGCGVASVIKRIQLMDGNEELDSLREANAWLTFKSFFRPNSEASSIKIPQQGGAGRGARSGTKMEISVPLPAQKFAADAATILTTGEEVFTGYVDLRVIFPLLGQMSHLNTKMFPNLRIVIEYETDQARIIRVGGNAPVPTTPILMADIITDDALVATLDKQLMAKPVMFDAIEVDRIGVPQIPLTDTLDPAGGTGAGSLYAQSLVLQSKGFLGKYVKRICIQKSSQDKDRYGGIATDLNVKGFGANGSLAMHLERANIRVNGRNLLGGDGYVTAGQMAMGMADTWGELNSFPYAALESVGLDIASAAAKNGPAGLPPTLPSLRVLGGAGADVAKQSVLVGQQAYIGFRIDERCDNLQLQYQRSGRFQAPAPVVPGTNTAMDLTMYAEVSKMLTVRGPGDWSVSYA